ncbi:unnamed protein product, partial [Iphiclides podalirius]
MRMHHVADVNCIRADDADPLFTRATQNCKTTIQNEQCGPTAARSTTRARCGHDTTRRSPDPPEYDVRPDAGRPDAKLPGPSRACPLLPAHNYVCFITYIHMSI